MGDHKGQRGCGERERENNRDRYTEAKLIFRWLKNRWPTVTVIKLLSLLTFKIILPPFLNMLLLLSSNIIFKHLSHSKKMTNIIYFIIICFITKLFWITTYNFIFLLTFKYDKLSNVMLEVNCNNNLGSEKYLIIHLIQKVISNV